MKKVLVVLVALVVVFLAGCGMTVAVGPSWELQYPQVGIKEVVSDPDRYLQKFVTLEGVVVGGCMTQRWSPLDGAYNHAYVIIAPMPLSTKENGNPVLLIDNIKAYKDFRVGDIVQATGSVNMAFSGGERGYYFKASAVTKKGEIKNPALTALAKAVKEELNRPKESMYDFLAGK
jgi:hypothetical protein